MCADAYSIEISFGAGPTRPTGAAKLRALRNTLPPIGRLVNASVGVYSTNEFVCRRERPVCVLPSLSIDARTSSLAPDRVRRPGELHGYVLTAPRRMASLPDVPTANELGVPSLAIGVWFGIHAPASTPQPVIAILNKALRARLAAQTAVWTPIIEKAGIQAE